MLGGGCGGWWYCRWWCFGALLLCCFVVVNLDIDGGDGDGGVLWRPWVVTHFGGTELWWLMVLGEGAGCRSVFW